MLNFKIISIIKITFTIWASFALGLSAQSDQESTAVFLDVEGLHLGQKPPGTIPELFLPEIFLEGAHSAPSFTPDGTEMFWSGYYTPEGNRSSTQHIFHSQFSEGQWSGPKLAPFSGTFSDGGPFLTSNGNRLFFYSNRPAEPGGKPSDESISNIWFVDKTGGGWGDPQQLPFNSYQHELMASVSNDGTIFFQSNRSGTRGIYDIYFAEFVDSTYTKPKNLGQGVNCAGINSSPLIAPDQSFIIIAYGHNTPDNGLFIAFKKQDGTWTNPVDMGETINSTSAQRFPGLSPDGRYLFFIRGGAYGDVFWVDASIIDDLK